MASGERRPGFLIELPGGDASPLRRIGARVLLALSLIAFVALITYAGRDGYVDPEGDRLSLLDAFYYSTVTITTTGYGDILPVTDNARLATTILVTPARVLFLVLLVGTTLEILAERTRTAYRIRRWRKGLKDHIIVCGYGTKGRTAIKTLLGTGVDPAQIVVIEAQQEARRLASAFGLAVIAGSATSPALLEEAEAGRARSVIVAVARDDAAVLITLTARELAPQATIIAAAREEENVHLLRQSGADSVVPSSGAAGRLLGMATDMPGVAEVLEDLLTVGEGLDIIEREVAPGQAGALADLEQREPILAVVRHGEILRFDDERAAEVRVGDRLVAIKTRT
jgi:voltage-gated potassium channel